MAGRGFSDSQSLVSCMKNESFTTLLNQKGMRATSKRLEVLAFVEEQKHPVGIELLRAQFPSINEATLYRMASDFVEKGIWNACDLGHGHVDFESANRPHHHHAVCEACGVIEEVYGCQKECQLIASFGRSAKQFQSLKAPSGAIFGTCHDCAGV